MSFRKAKESDVPELTALVGRGARGPLSNPPEAIATQIKRDIESGQANWVVAESDRTIARIAVIPAPPIYSLNGLAGIVLGAWGPPGTEPNVDALEQHLSDHGVAMLVMACAADDTSMRKQLSTRGYVATTDFRLKQRLTPAATQSARRATEDDIPALVAFNREGRERLHEANPAFWTSHPDAETRFALWMKLSLTMRDRTVLVTGREGSTSGFVIAQPASPIQVPITHDETAIGVIDDFHCPSFGASLTSSGDPATAEELLHAAESDFADRGKTAAIAISPVAWKAKSSVLERLGYQTLFTWHTKPV